ncbi:MAG: choice-of-anchor Q domain-containing protein [Pirellulales bacterium]
MPQRPRRNREAAVSKPRSATGSFPYRRRLRFEPLEDRRLLANVTVSNLNDVVNGTTTSIAALIATPGADGISLREAILAANADAAADTVDFGPTVTGTIQLTDVGHVGQIAITNNLTINGPGSNLLTINAFDPTPVTKNGDGSRVFNIDDSNLATFKDVLISGLTLTGGDIGGEGGAIFTRENLSVTASTISGNSALVGGGIFSLGGDVTVTDSTISDNSATIGSGGGIWKAYGHLAVTDSTISGNSAESDGGGIYNANGELTVIGSTISGNSALINNGGGIYSLGGNVTVTSSTISGNSATGDRFSKGGGIDSRAGSLTDTLTVTDSTISDNSAGGNGGGLYHRGGGGTVVTSSTISGNSAGRSGGGIFSYGGDVTVTDSTISGNSALGGQQYDGGGIHMSGIGELTVTNTTISGNSTNGRGGGILGSSNVTVTNSTISGNSAGTHGGGIYGDGSVTDSTISGNSAGGSGGGIFGGVITVTNSTISGNTAFADGGGISSTVLTVSNSTISGNSSGGSGGGISKNFSGGSHTVTNSTISGNSAAVDGGGIAATDVIPTLRHTIVAGNTRGAAATSNDVTGSVALAFSLLGVDTGATITDDGGNLIGTAAAPIDPLLGPLADNGGPTFTHALLPGSPAIDAGDPAAVSGMGNVPLYDQRGAPFSRVADGDGMAGVRIDIGAFEVQPVGPALPGDYNQNSVVDAADFVLWRKTLGTGGLPAYAGADGNGNGTVGPEDYGVWTAHFGETLPGAGIDGLVASVEWGVGSVVASGEGGRGKAEGELGIDFGELSRVADFGVPGSEGRGTSVKSRESRVEGQESEGWREDALVAWVALRVGGGVSQGDAVMNDSDGSDSNDDSHEFTLDAVDSVFAELSLSAVRL